MIYYDIMSVHMIVITLQYNIHYTIYTIQYTVYNILYYTILYYTILYYNTEGVDVVVHAELLPREGGRILSIEMLLARIARQRSYCLASIR